MRILLVIVAALLFAPLACAADAAPIEVMVLGTYHMDNPGQDISNIRAENVLTPRRQAEIAAVTRALARYRPTLVAVERITTAPGYVDPLYAKFDPAQLATSRDERVQIGYRLAHELGLATVHGIDEQPSAGEPDYFPFDRIQAAAKAHGAEPQLQAMFDELGRMTSAFEARQATATIGELLAEVNGPRTHVDASFYYGLLSLDAGEDQPGAELLGYWTMRNAKIFAKLLDVARPGDRVLVIFGSGHKHWLEQLAANMPGVRVVDPLPYLQ